MHSTAATTGAPTPGEQSAASPAISVRGLIKRYGDVTAVDGIDFEVHLGTCLGVLGPNGAGKTTTIEILEGLKKPDAGEVRVLGRSWDAPAQARQIQQRIGVQLQETEFQDKVRVFELLRLFRSFYPRGKTIDEVIDIIGLAEKRSAMVKTLSGGQKQRLSIGCALLNDPEILFLDEPTTGLDPQARRRVWEVIETFKAAGGTVLLTTHYMEEAERLADDLIIVDHGKIITRGSPASIIASLGVESLVRFSLMDARIGAEGAPLPDGLDRDLGALDGVREVRRDNEFITLSVTQTRSVIVGLLELVAARGLQLDDLSTHRPTLEDVFVALTGKSLRDG